MDPAERLCIEVVYCPQPGVADRVQLQLPRGTTVADAVHASGLAQRHALTPADLRLGVWCAACDAHHTLRDGDRVEIYRPLIVDPKEARRQRYKRHLERVAAR